MKIIKNALIKDYTTYKLSGHIKEVVYPKTLSELISLLKQLKDKKYKVIGNGSNLIFLNDYDGTIIKLDNFNKIDINKNIVTVQSGVNLIALAMKTANIGLGGLEFAAGIPAQIGGAVYMNAGAYKSQMSDVIKEITVIDREGNLKKLTKEQLDFGYRKSALQNSKYICISAVLELKYGDKKEILDLIKSRKERRIDSQPLEYPSAGSVFRNPPDDYAGRIIEELSLKGKRIGDAVISTKHANFIINVGNASGKDIEELINLVKRVVKEEYNIELKQEQEYVE